MSDISQQQDRLSAMKLLERWANKPLDSKDPHYKYYLTASCYLSLIRFILPTSSKELLAQGANIFLENKLQNADVYLPPGALEIITPCVQEAQNEFAKKQSTEHSTGAYPSLASAPSAPALTPASPAGAGLFAPSAPVAPVSQQPIRQEEQQPGLYPLMG